MYVSIMGAVRRCRPRCFCLLLALSILPGARGQESLPVETAALSLAASPAVATGNNYTPRTRHERRHGYLHETFLCTQPALQVFGTGLLDRFGHAPTRWGVGSHGCTHRVGHALERTPFTYNESGGRVVDVSALTFVKKQTIDIGRARHP